MKRSSKSSPYAYQLYDKEKDRYATAVKVDQWGSYNSRYTIVYTKTPGRGTMASFETVTRFYQNIFELQRIKDHMIDFELNCDKPGSALTQRMVLEDKKDREHYVKNINQSIADSKKLQLRRVKLETVKTDDEFEKEKHKRVDKIINNTFITRIENDYEDGIQIAKHYTSNSSVVDKNKDGVYIKLYEERSMGEISEIQIKKHLKKIGVDCEFLSKPYGFIGIIFIKEPKDISLLQVSIPSDWSVEFNVTVSEIRKKYTDIHEMVSQQMEKCWDL